LLAASLALAISGCPSVLLAVSLALAISGCPSALLAAFDDAGDAVGCAGPLLSAVAPSAAELAWSFADDAEMEIDWSL
jgi:hypothetical protein